MSNFVSLSNEISCKVSDILNKWTSKSLLGKYFPCFGPMVPCTPECLIWVRSRSPAFKCFDFIPPYTFQNVLFKFQYCLRFYFEVCCLCKILILDDSKCSPTISRQVGIPLPLHSTSPNLPPTLPTHLNTSIMNFILKN